MATELDEFLTWYNTRVFRKTGRYPAPSTLKSKRTRLNSAVRISGSGGLVALATLLQDREQVECFLDKLLVNMSPGSARHVVDALRDFAPYAVAKGWCSGIAITADDTPPSNPKKPINVYTPEEVDLLVTSARARSLRFWCFLATLAETGRRVGEVLSLEWDRLALSAEVPHFELPNTKNKRQALVPLSRMLREEVFTPENIEALKSEQREGVRAFGRSPEQYPFPWTYGCVTKMFRRHCTAMGIEDRGFHNFRHTKATELLARGVPIQAVSSLLGHASVATTDRIYNHADALAYATYLE